MNSKASLSASRPFTEGTYHIAPNSGPIVPGKKSQSCRVAHLVDRVLRLNVAITDSRYSTITLIINGLDRWM